MSFSSSFFIPLQFSLMHTHSTLSSFKIHASRSPQQLSPPCIYTFKFHFLSRFAKTAHNMQWFPLFNETIKSHLFSVWWFWNWSLICHVLFSVNSEAFLHHDLSKANAEINELSRDQTNLCSSPVKAPVITLFTWHMTSGPTSAAFLYLWLYTVHLQFINSYTSLIANKTLTMPFHHVFISFQKFSV